MTDQVFDPRQVLGVPPGATAEEILAAHRTHIRRLHPDAGGTDGLASMINRARDMLLEELARRPTPTYEPPTDPTPPTSWQDAPPPPMDEPQAALPRPRNPRESVLFLVTAVVTLGIAITITVMESIVVVAIYLGLYGVLAGAPIGYALARNKIEVAKNVRRLFVFGAGFAALSAFLAVTDGEYLVVAPMVPVAALGAICTRSVLDTGALPIGDIRFGRSAWRDPRSLAVMLGVGTITLAGAGVAVYTLIASMIPLFIMAVVGWLLICLLYVYLRLRYG